MLCPIKITARDSSKSVLGLELTDYSAINVEKAEIKFTMLKGALNLKEFPRSFYTNHPTNK